MRNITRVSLVLAGSAALVGSMALPASAADTTTTVTVFSGTIEITAQPSAAFGVVNPGDTATVPLTGVKVTDNRAGTAGWTASVASGDFTGAAGTISATAASYTPGAATVAGGGTATVESSLEQSDLSIVKTVQTATAVSGNHTATWDGTLELLVPANALAGDYSAVVTHSLL